MQLSKRQKTVSKIVWYLNADGLADFGEVDSLLEGSERQSPITPDNAKIERSLEQLRQPQIARVLRLAVSNGRLV